jgi:hypothetical protein
MYSSRHPFSLEDRRLQGHGHVPAFFYVKVEGALMIDQLPLSRVYEETGYLCDIIDCGFLGSDAL